jgi:hypothetical protein
LQNLGKPKLLERGKTTRVHRCNQIFILDIGKGNGKRMRLLII